MGAAARRIVHAPVMPARPRLRVVRGGRRSASARTAAHAAAGFRVVAACVAVLALAGVLRVSLAVRAAEAAIDASALRVELKSERQAGRVLEADKSTLAAPSRIEVLASQALNMGRPADVRYLQLPEAAEQAVPVPEADTAATPAGRIIATFMDLAAGEAQVLLVGDVGLGPIR